MTEEAHAHEIVIIKRHGGHEDAHHGGVWKIAFADFMTAMMAFFLVMWLVSANDKTKAVIAKYFNPVELVDSTPQPPGLNDSKKGDPSIQRETKKPAPDGGVKDAKSQGASQASADTPDKPIIEAAATAAATDAHDEAELARDPYAVLAEIANKANREAPEKTKAPHIEDAQRGTGAQGQKGGEAFRDPFQPLQAGSSEAPAAGRPDAAASGAGSKSAALAAADPLPPPPAAGAPAAPLPEAAPGVAAPAPTSTPAPAPAAAAVPPASADMAPALPAATADAAAALPADKAMPPAMLRARIAALGKAAEAAGSEAAPKLDVRQTAEGLLISLTDSADFSMFPTSSARPAAKMVTLVEKIGVLLKSQKGTITVRGFTDSRPFKSDTYDNWRLSSARAQIAHYMLVQGGVSDSRIDHIEGYADRRPKNPKNPDAAENRRIEILLRDPTP